MNFPSKANVKVASVRPNKFDLSHQAIYTNDFGKLLPCFVRNTIPNETYINKSDCFVRTAPLALPTFGRVSRGFDTFFVRFDQVWKGFNDLYTKNSRSLQNSVTQITDFPYFTVQ